MVNQSRTTYGRRTTTAPERKEKNASVFREISHEDERHNDFNEFIISLLVYNDRFSTERDSQWQRLRRTDTSERAASTSITACYDLPTVIKANEKKKKKPITHDYFSGGGGGGF